MTTGTSDRAGIERALRRWERAHLIDHRESRAILAWEAAHQAERPATAVPPHITVTEALIYVATLVGLIGASVMLFATSVGHFTRGALATGLAIAGALVALTLERRTDGPSLRGSGAAAALTVAAIGTAITQFLEAGGWLVQSRTAIPMLYPLPPGFQPSTEVNGGWAIAAGSVATLLLAAGAVLRRRSELPVILVGGFAAYVGAGSTIDAIDFAGPEIARPVAALIIAMAGLALMILSLLAVNRSSHNLLEGVAIAVTTVSFYGLGGSPYLELDIMGALVAAAAVVAGTRFRREGMAFAGAVGMAALVVDIGARNFNSETTLGMFLILSALFGLGLILGMRRLIARR